MLADNTKTAMVTLFNDAIISLIDTPCVEMVIQHGYDNPQQIPKPTETIRGKEKIFLLQFNNRFYNKLCGQPGF
ncbi:hypothetical protein Hdeb2414_s0023g00637441 [Helianthus debilis subsp. tardiflorus]